MRKSISKLYRITLIICNLSLLLMSCTPAGNAGGQVSRSAPIRSGRAKDISEIIPLINSGNFNIAERELITGINSDPLNAEYRKALGLLYFRSMNYSAAERFIRSALKTDPELFDSVNRNIEFDLFYAFVSSMLKQNKLNSASGYFSLVTEPSLLNEDNSIRYELLWIEYYFRSRNFESAEEKASSTIRSGKIENGMKLNLYYILSVSSLNLGRTDEALDYAVFLVLNDTEFKYTRKIKRLLDGIVNTASEQTLDDLRSKIADGYRELAVRCGDNANLRERILMAINTLENSELSVEMISPQGGQSYISKVRIFTDRDVTSVYITSADSLYYDNPPLYDGRSLTLRIPGKKINSAVTRQSSLPGSGIESVEWDSGGDTLVFKVNLQSNLNLTVEKSSGETFERYDSIMDRYSLKINVYLPETASAVQTPELDLGEDRFTIVLDPGHGGDDPGALSELRKSDGSKYTESEVNLYLCRLLKKYLEDKGYRVFLTRDGNYYPSLHERNRIAQNRNADMFISMHLNAASVKNRKYWQTDRYYGAEMLVRESIGQMPEFINFQQSNVEDWRRKREKALSEHRKLSNILARTIPEGLHSPFNKKRNIVRRNLVIFSGMTIPHALIEAGFMINNKNLEYLLSDRGQQALFKGILEGIEEYRKTSR